MILSVRPILLFRGGFHLADQLLRGAVVVFAGELAEAGDCEVEFACHECSAGVGATCVMLDALLELAGEPVFRCGAELLFELLDEYVAFHAGVQDELFCVAFHFHIIVFHEVTETHVCADQGTEKFCHLGLCVI